MRKIAAVERIAPAVAQIDLSSVRSRQRAGVLWSARGWGDMLLWEWGEWGEWGVGGNENNCGLEVEGSRINFNRRDPLAGFKTPVFA